MTRRTGSQGLLSLYTQHCPRSYHWQIKAITKAVCEPSARVYEYARRVDTAHKRATRRRRLRHDAARVVRALRVDMRDCGGERRHGERQRDSEVFGSVSVWRRGQHVALRRGTARRPREAYALVHQARSFEAGFHAQEAS